MTGELARRLARRIRLAGPVTVAEYMATCLYDPEHGYYTTREPFGSGGDFVTAPEISQVFGELVAVWLVHAWRAIGMPAPFAFAEIGPGRGTLMADMLRTLGKLDRDCLSAAQVLMIETSPRLQSVQRRTLGSAAGEIAWIGSPRALPALPLLMIGNEVFDALPIHQYVCTEAGWLERTIGLDASGRFAFHAGPGAIDAGFLPPGHEETPSGAIFEVAPAREALAAEISGHIAACGGAGLFFDYGHGEPGFGDTLQAVRGHCREDVLANPGKADLTAHVDFSALIRVASTHGIGGALLDQGQFLLRMGLRERAARLAAGTGESVRAAIAAAVARLSDPDQMGRLFKALCLFPGPEAPYPFAAGSAEVSPGASVSGPAIDFGAAPLHDPRYENSGS